MVNHGAGRRDARVEARAKTEQEMILVDTRELTRPTQRKLHAAWQELQGRQVLATPSVARELAPLAVDVPWMGRPSDAENRLRAGGSRLPQRRENKLRQQAGGERSNTARCRDIVICCGSRVWRDQAASFRASLSVWQRSSGTPSTNGTPARTRGSRCVPFSRRHRRCGMSNSL